MWVFELSVNYIVYLKKEFFSFDTQLNKMKMFKEEP